MAARSFDETFRRLATGLPALQEEIMDILKAIDIALGMIVVYLTFSLGVTAFNEALAGR